MSGSLIDYLQDTLLSSKSQMDDRMVRVNAHKYPKINEYQQNNCGYQHPKGDSLPILVVLLTLGDMFGAFVDCMILYYCPLRSNIVIFVKTQKSGRNENLIASLL